jgi:alkylation response protein AidB-like acyl-CoA dehydrogenase
MQRRLDTYLQSLVSQEHMAFYQAVGNFAEHDIAPHLLTWERQQCLLSDNIIAAMGDLGLFGLTVAEQYGGQGGGQTELVLMGLALGYHSQSVAITPGAAASLGIKPLQLCGSESLKQQHLPELATG